jgi:hypothetical protein
MGAPRKNPASANSPPDGNESGSLFLSVTAYPFKTTENPKTEVWLPSVNPLNEIQEVE